MAEITLEHRRTALLIADFYAEQMSKLEHARSRHCVEKTVAVREAARKAGIQTAKPEIGGIAGGVECYAEIVFSFVDPLARVVFHTVPFPE